MSHSMTVRNSEIIAKMSKMPFLPVEPQFIISKVVVMGTKCGTIQSLKRMIMYFICILLLKSVRGFDNKIKGNQWLSVDPQMPFI